jgi:hypothetical protein
METIHCTNDNLNISVADPDPGSGAFLTTGSGIRNPGWVKNQDPDPHISESLEIIFWVKKTPKFFFLCGCGSGMEKNSDSGSGINIPDVELGLMRSTTRVPA